MRTDADDRARVRDSANERVLNHSARLTDDSGVTGRAPPGAQRHVLPKRSTMGSGRPTLVAPVARRTN